MVKRSLFFSNPYHLSSSNRQLVIKSKEDGAQKTLPMEDIGFVVLENPQITFTQAFISEMASNNVAVVFCNDRFMPVSMLWHLDSHTIQTERFKAQINSSEPLKKSVWKQTMKAKIGNQAAMLEWVGKPKDDLDYLAGKVKSGDPENIEGRAAKRYWSKLFGGDFQRIRVGPAPNPALNYGYIVLRAAVSRALVGSGLLPSIGIHHRNRYNSFCLADDVMEPYRPYVDMIVFEMWESGMNTENLSTKEKAELIKVLTLDVQMGEKLRPLMIALSETSSTLAECFSGTRKKVNYPEF